MILSGHFNIHSITFGGKYLYSTMLLYFTCCIRDKEVYLYIHLSQIKKTKEGRISNFDNQESREDRVT